MLMPLLRVKMVIVGVESDCGHVWRCYRTWRCLGLRVSLNPAGIDDDSVSDSDIGQAE